MKRLKDLNKPAKYIGARRSTLARVPSHMYMLCACANRTCSQNNL